MFVYILVTSGHEKISKQLSESTFLKVVFRPWTLHQMSGWRPLDRLIPTMPWTSSIRALLCMWERNLNVNLIWKLKSQNLRYTFERHILFKHSYHHRDEIITVAAFQIIEKMIKTLLDYNRIDRLCLAGEYLKHNYNKKR